jgi:peptide/nickel transport system permease protein
MTRATATLRLLGVQLFWLVLTLFVSSLLIYGALYIAPGGGPLGALLGGRSMDPAAIERLKEQYHLNDPFLVQYWNWLSNVLHGDLGTSLIYKEPVSDLVGSRLVVTLQLVGFAGLLIVVCGIGLGVLAALRPKFVGTGIVAVTSLGMAVPQFVAAMLLISVFSVTLGWFPVLGEGAGFLDRVWHLTLPAIALALSGLAYVTLVANAEVRNQLRSEHVQTATVRGLSKRRVLRRHVLRNAMIPITTVVGLTVAALFAAVAVVEDAFSLNGLGAYLIASINQRDFAVVQAIALLLVAIFVVVNAVVDLLYALLDPRLSGRAQGA